MIRQWADGKSTAKPSTIVWRRFVVPTLLPILIAGAATASLLVPAGNRRIVVLAFFMEPEDGVVVGVNGPHRLFPQTQAEPVEKTQAVKTPANEFEDLESLTGRLNQLKPAETLVLFVSAVAATEQGRVLLMPNAASALNPSKVFIQDLLRAVNQSRSHQRLLVLDIQWQADQETTNVSLDDDNLVGSNPSTAWSKNLYEELVSAIREQQHPRTTYILTAGPNAWASGMESPRQSAFVHFWTESLSNHSADRNNDGRLSVLEVFEQTKQKLASWSADNCQFIQTPEILGDSGFDLGPIQSVPWPLVSNDQYPDFLLAAWTKRDQYLNRSDIAADSGFVDLWQAKLLAVESRWRRAVNLTTAKSEAEAISLWADQQVLAQTEIAAARRPDSLWLAAKSAIEVGNPAGTANAADAIVQQLSQIKTAPTDPATTKAAEQILAVELKDASSATKLRTLDALMTELCGTTLPNPSLPVTVVLLAKDLKLEDAFAELITLQQLSEIDYAGREPNDLEVDQALLRLIRIRSQLGERPRLFAVMAPRLDGLMDECLTAEQFYWLDGFTSKENVRNQVMAAVSRVEIGLSQQACIEDAMSTVEQAIAFLTCGQAVPHHEEYFLRTLENTEKLSVALYGHSKLSIEMPPEIAAVRFESIRYHSEQLRAVMQKLLADAVAHADACSCDSLLSIVPAAMRPEIYAKLLAGKRLRSEDQLASRCFDVVESTPGYIGPDGLRGIAKAGLCKTVSQEELMQRVSKIQQLVSEAETIGVEQMEGWLQHLAQSVVATHDPTGFYQNLANRLRFRTAPTQSPLLSVAWAQSPISWDNPQAELVVKFSDVVNSPMPVAGKVSLLETASSSLKGIPSCTVITPLEPGRFRFDLRVRANEESTTTLKGVWLKLERPNGAKFFPIRFPDVHTCQLVELSTEGAAVNGGSRSVWRLWPKQDAQLFDWTLVNHDKIARSVIVTVSGQARKGDAELLLQSSVMNLPPAMPQAVRFPATSPTKISENTPIEQPNIQTLFIKVADSKSNEILLERTFELQLVDVRSCVQIGETQFVVEDRGSANKLSIELQGTPSADPQGHIAQLALTADTLPTLRKIGSGTSSLRLFPAGSRQRLLLQNLSIAEGIQGSWSIPLAIDGDTEAMRLIGLTPYLESQTDWQLDSEPRVFLDAPSAVLPGTSLRARLGGMNFPSNAMLFIQYGHNDGGKYVVHHQTSVPAPRYPRVYFDTGGKNATFRVQACYDRWSVDIPTTPIDGQYEIRVLTVDGLLMANRSVMLDGSLPSIVSATASTADLTKIMVQTIAGPSGITSVSMIAADKTQTVATQQSDANGAIADQWVLQAKQPISATEATVVTLEAISGAGKKSTVDLLVRLETPSTTGILEGVVVEGSIPQPNLIVTIRDSRGQQYELRTDDDGTFRGSLPAGTYALSVNKKATGRTSQTTVRIDAGKSSQLQMELLLPSRQRKA